MTLAFLDSFTTVGDAIILFFIMMAALILLVGAVFFLWWARENQEKIWVWKRRMRARIRTLFNPVMQAFTWEKFERQKEDRFCFWLGFCFWFFGILLAAITHKSKGIAKSLIGCIVSIAATVLLYFMSPIRIECNGRSIVFLLMSIVYLGFCVYGLVCIVQCGTRLGSREEK